MLVFRRIVSSLDSTHSRVKLIALKNSHCCFANISGRKIKPAPSHHILKDDSFSVINEILQWQPRPVSYPSSLWSVFARLLPASVYLVSATGGLLSEATATNNGGNRIVVAAPGYGVFFTRVRARWNCDESNYISERRASVYRGRKVSKSNRPSSESCHSEFFDRGEQKSRVKRNLVSGELQRKMLIFCLINVSGKLQKSAWHERLRCKSTAVDSEKDMECL